MPKIGPFEPGDIVGTAANHSVFTKPDGLLTMVGGARVINHVIIHAGSFKLAGANQAAIGIDGLFITYDFVHNAMKEIWGSQFVPYRWDNTTDISAHLDWFTDADGTGGDVVWGLDYLGRADNEEAGAAAAASITQAFTGAGPGLIQRSEFTTKILKTNIAADDLLGVRIWRDTGDAADTLALTARFLALHLHFIRDKIGKPT